MQRNFLALAAAVAVILNCSAAFGQGADASMAGPAAAAEDSAGAGAESAEPETALSDVEIEAAAHGAAGAADGAPAAEGVGAAAAQLAFLLEAGGPVLMILFALSVLTLALIVVKVVQFALARVGARGFVPEAVALLRAGRSQDALDLLAERRGPTARVMEAAIRGRMSPAAAADLVREEVTRIAQARIDGLERGLPLLGLVATISPLLGLLGTVTGMIEAFRNLQQAGDRVDPAILSGGIWEALLTTAAGLAIAIPAAAVFTWLQRTVEVAGQRMEDGATQVFTVDLYAATASDASGAEGVAPSREAA